MIRPEGPPPVVCEYRIAALDIDSRPVLKLWSEVLGTLPLIASTLRITCGRRADLFLEIAALRH